jgi:hypothetical protein
MDILNVTILPLKKICPKRKTDTLLSKMSVIEW